MKLFYQTLVLVHLGGLTTFVNAATAWGWDAHYTGLKPNEAPFLLTNRGTINEPYWNNQNLVISTSDNVEQQFYYRSGLSIPQSLMINARLKVSETNRDVPNGRTGVGIAWTVAPNRGNALFFSDSQIALLQNYGSFANAKDVTTTEFHEYTIIIDEDNIPDNDDVKVFIDDDKELALEFDNFYDDQLFSDETIAFGDLTILAAGASEWMSFHHNATIGTIGTSGATVPMPAALPLFCSALGMLSIAGWKRKKSP